MEVFMGSGIVLAPIKYVNYKIRGSKEFDALPTISNAPQSDIVIYCVHGTASCPNVFKQLVSQLTQLLAIYHPQIRYTIRTPQFSDRFIGTSILDYSNQLSNEIIKNNDQMKPIIFIGHSRGGLVASELASRQNLNILSIINIATPFKGTSLSSFPLHFMKIISTSIKQMLTCQNYLEELRSKICNLGIDFQYYVGSKDNVIPIDAAHPYHQSHHHLDNFNLIDGHDHSSILAAPEVAFSIKNQIFNCYRSLTETIATNDINTMIPTHYKYYYR